MSALNKLLQLLLLCAQCIQISADQIIIQDLSLFLKSFEKCLVTVLLFEAHIHLEPFSHAVIIGDGNKTTNLSDARNLPIVIQRKKFFCVAYLFINPAVSRRTPTETEPWKVKDFFIHNLLEAYGVEFFKHATFEHGGRLQFLEPYFQGVISPGNFSVWVKDLVGYQSTPHLATTLYFQTTQINDSASRFLSAGYLCKVCRSGFVVLVKIDLEPYFLETCFAQLLQLEKAATEDGHHVLWNSAVPFNRQQVARTPPWSMSESQKLNVVFVIRAITFDSLDLLNSTDTGSGQYEIFPIVWHNTNAKHHSHSLLSVHSTELIAEKISFMGRLIPIGYNSLNFLTCHGVFQHPFQFRSFVKPYDYTTWIFITISAFTSIIFLCLVSRNGLITWPLATFVELIIMYFGILLEQSSLLSKLIVDSEKLMQFWKLIFGMWLLFSILFTNAYKGVVVTDLLAPPNWKPNWTSIAQIPNDFKLYSPIHPKLAFFIPQFFDSVAKSHNVTWRDRLVSRLDLGLNSKDVVGFWDGLIITYLDEQAHYFPSSQEKMDIQQRMRKGKTQLESKPRLFFDALASCNRTVFVTGDGENVNAFMDYFNALSGRQKFFKGNSFWALMEYVIMDDHRKPYIAQPYFRTHGIIASGIYDLFKRWSAYSQVANTRRRNFVPGSECVSPCAVRLGPQLLYMIYMFLVGLLVALTMFIAEWVYTLLKNVHKCRNISRKGCTRTTLINIYEYITYLLDKVY